MITPSPLPRSDVPSRSEQEPLCGAGGVWPDAAPGAPGPHGLVLSVKAIDVAAAQTTADTVAIGVFDEDRSHVVGRADIAPDDLRTDLGAVTVAASEGKRWLFVGLGDQSAFTTERARLAAAYAHDKARELSSRVLCWDLPGADRATVGAVVEATHMASFDFGRFKTADPSPFLAQLLVSCGPQASRVVDAADVVGRAVNRARELQEIPANYLTPTRLAEYAEDLMGSTEHVGVTIEGRREIAARGMGAFAAVAAGSEEEPALITIRYDPPGALGPTIGLVGKAVTFDSGGLSLKTADDMTEQKFDMSGGAAVIEAVAAVAELGLPVSLIGVLGATENLPGSGAVRPGDIVTAMNGTTIEVVNTDAEGRLVLADCLSHAVSLGAERLVDVATLTNGVVVALGSVHAGLLSNDDRWAAALVRAGDETGELLWRLPMTADYDRLIEGRCADINNQAEEPRKASAIVGAKFLERFVAGVPWAHLDISGMAQHLNKPYSARGASGFGVRLLVELAARTADDHPLAESHGQ